MRAGVFLRWVAHPLTVAATAVLLLNDHVFKQAWPGVVTGKLSDVAGLVVAPAVLGLLFGLFRAGPFGAAAAALLTGAGFAWVKLSSTGAEVASAAWSVVNGPSVVLADPSDLIALPALGLAWWAWRRSAAAPPLPDHPAHRLRLVLATPFAVLAIAATSASDDTIPSVDSVQLTGEQVIIEVSRRFYGSDSGIGEWTLLPETPPGQLPERRQLEACVPDDTAHCYRVHGGGDLDTVERRPHGGRLLGVDETTDAGQTWHTVWEVPAARWPFVERQHSLPDGVDRTSKVASVDVLVRSAPGGHEVIVANGVEGLAVRDAGGAWRRVPVVVAATGVDIRPAPLTGFGQVIGDDVGDAGLITLLALLIGMSVAAARITRGGGRRRRGGDRSGVPRTFPRLDCGPPRRARDRRPARSDPRGGMRAPDRRGRLVGGPRPGDHRRRGRPRFSRAWSWLCWLSGRSTASSAHWWSHCVDMGFNRFS